MLKSFCIIFSPISYIMIITLSLFTHAAVTGLSSMVNNVLLTFLMASHLSLTCLHNTCSCGFVTWLAAHVSSSSNCRSQLYSYLLTYLSFRCHTIVYTVLVAAVTVGIYNSCFQGKVFYSHLCFGVGTHLRLCYQLLTYLLTHSSLVKEIYGWNSQSCDDSSRGKRMP